MVHSLCQKNGLKTSHRLIGVLHTDIKLFEGDMSLGPYELGIMRRCLEKANRRFAERAVAAPKAEGEASAMKALIDAAKDEEIVTVLEVRPRLKVRLGLSLGACWSMCHARCCRISPSGSYQTCACRPQKLATTSLR